MEDVRWGGYCEKNWKFGAGPKGNTGIYPNFPTGKREAHIEYFCLFVVCLVGCLVGLVRLAKRRGK